jgi:hypothetical protein
VLEATVDERLPRGLHDVSIGFGSDGKPWWKRDEVIAVDMGF